MADAAAPPDYIGAGTPDSGTAWWHDLVRQHPALRTPRRGRLHFFDQFCGREMTDADVQAYHRMFPEPRAGRIRGEWTARYMYDAWTPLLLSRAAPGAKLLVMVSDPIERYRRRLEAELAVERGEDDSEIFMTTTILRGRYATQLERLRRFHDPERILVLQYERCRADPVGEYARTMRFLGVDDGYLPRVLRRRVARARRRERRRGPNPPPYVPLLQAFGVVRLYHALTRRRTPRQRREPLPLWPDVLSALHADLDPEVERLAELVPDLDLTLWPNFGGREAEPVAA